MNSDNDLLQYIYDNECSACALSKPKRPTVDCLIKQNAIIKKTSTSLNNINKLFWINKTPHCKNFVGKDTK